MKFTFVLFRKSFFVSTFQLVKPIFHLCVSVSATGNTIIEHQGFDDFVGEGELPCCVTHILSFLLIIFTSVISPIFHSLQPSNKIDTFPPPLDDFFTVPSFCWRPSLIWQRKLTLMNYKINFADFQTDQTSNGFHLQVKERSR